MQWSYHLCSTITATTSKFKMAVEIGVFRLIREALYFFSLIFSSHSTRELYDKVQDSCYILRPRVWKKSENFILRFILILISVTRVFFHVDSVSKKNFFRPSIFSQKWPFGVKNGQNGRFSRFKNIFHPYFHLQCIQTI